MLRKLLVVLVAASLLAAFAGVAGADYLNPKLVGEYQGTFIGDDYGSFLVTVNPDGSITGTAHSNVTYQDMGVSGACQIDGTCEFATTETPLYFKGKIDFMNRLIGKWAYTDHSGRGSFFAIIQQE
ncbi:MAG: hypothetical protein U9R40_04170 [Synergistota bacterium]|nr:hypothetical protein [Synergistota bacterium]